MKTKMCLIVTMVLFHSFNVFGKETVSIPIKEGWTAFGVPVTINNPYILDYIPAEQVEIIKTLENNTWKYFRNQDTDDFDSFVPGRGYFIKAKTAFTITFEGYWVGYPKLIEGENFVTLPVNKLTTAQEFLEKFSLYEGSIKRIATYDGPWGPGWGAVDGSKFDAFSELESHRGYIVVVNTVWSLDIEPPEINQSYFWNSPAANFINILFYAANDNTTNTQNLKYSVFIITGDNYSCLEDLDKREPSNTCNVQKVISEQVPQGVWHPAVRGETLQYYYMETQITTDITGLIPNTEYAITIVVEDENKNKSQYNIVQTTTHTND
jgi:hypothetical protein